MTHRYSVHVFCDECSSPHPAGITVAFQEAIDENQSVADLYDGRELPPSLLTVTANSYVCPKTRKSFIQRDNHQVFLVRQHPCEDGDVSVSRFPGGYLVGYVRVRGGDTSWELLTADGTLHGALRAAREAAEAAGKKAWMQESDGMIREIPQGPPER